jgi:iron complex outermembrane receptor protein
MRRVSGPWTMACRSRPPRACATRPAEAEGGALGAAWIDGGSTLAASIDTYRNDCGVTTVGPDATIRMRRDRLGLAGRWRLPGGWLSEMSVKAGATCYEHQEVEGGGEVGTTFDSRGADLRVEARHAPLGPFSGVVGLQAEGLRFSALGAQAFDPRTRTRSAALFVLEEWRLAGATWNAGVCAESVRVSSDGARR